ncbi:putative large exoprotein [Aquitalea magnusonii]|uniref:Putative large exoprotein n=1 Tax=Aquitalea magnusonii TaxID=332411 RepID=A0A3G9GEQ3_9NEIS|nr:putative large exoprotein [Aquitalea magnusonii]
MVNITTPTSSGVSHNQYEQFNVGRAGAILNNSPTLNPTQLGGYINGNANLIPGNSARIILNEVIAPNPSQLRGMLEVAGQKAEVIIANPWGISVGAGAGFINTSNATLTTGTPQLSNGSLTGYQVSRGSVSVDGQADVSVLDSFTIISRALQLNAGLYAKQLNVVLGANQVDKATLTATPIQGNGPAPALALDVAQLGGMYAGAIKLIGTEAGVGVNSKGQIQATSGTLQLTSAGDLVLSGSTSAQGDMTLEALDNLSNSGTISSTGKLSARGAQAQLDGTMAAGGDLTVTAISVTGHGGLAAGSREDGTLGELGSLRISAAENLQHHGRLLAAQDVVLTGERVQLDEANISSVHGDISAQSDSDLSLADAKLIASGQVSLQAKGVLDTHQGSVAGRDLQITAQALNNQQGMLAQVGTGSLLLDVAGNIDNSHGRIVGDGQLLLTAGQLANTAGLIQADKLTLNSGSVNNQGGTMLALNEDSQHALHVRGAFDNSHAGQILTNGDWQIAADSLSNRQGTIQALRALNISSVNDVDNNSGQLSSGSQFVLDAAGFNNQYGTLQSAGTITARLLGVLDNRNGKVLSNQAMSLRLQRLFNQQGIVSGGGVTAIAAQSLNNQQGRVIGGQSLSLSLVDNFTFSQGDTLSSTGALQLDTMGDIINSGNWQSTGDMSLSARNVSNNTGAQLIAGGALSATASASVGNQGRMEGSQVDVKADVINNSGMISANRLSANARHLQNQGSAAVLAATEQLDVSASERLSNTDGALMYSAGSMNLHSGGLLENISSFIAAEGDVNVDASRLENRRSAVVIQREAETSSYGWNKYNYYWRSFGARGQGDISAVTKTLLVNSPEAANSYYGTILQLDQANKKALVRYQGDHELWVNYNAIQKNADGSYDMTFYEGKACLGRGETCPYQQIVWREYTGVPRVEQWDPNLHVNPITLNDIDDLYNFRERSVSGTRYLDKLISAGAASTLDAGKKLTLNVGSLLNDASRITANGDLAIVGASSVINQSYSINERLHETGVDHYDKHVGIHWYRSWTRDETSSVQTLDAVIAGNQGVSIAAPVIDNVTQEQAQTTKVPTVGATAGQADPGDALANLLVKLPNNGLFTQTSYPGAHYLIETDPRFTQYSNFISSDYMLQQLGFDPNVIQKRLGDGYYEQKLVKDQILSLTGAASRNGKDATEQYKQLLNSGAKVGQSFQLQLGVALSPEQIARLQEDIVWMVSETVQTASGPQQVLVPKVYLASTSPQLRADGALISGKSLNLQASRLNNQGQLHSAEQLVIQADQLNHQGGLIDGQSVSLSAKQLNLSTDLQHSGRTAEVRGTDIKLSGDDVTLRGAKINASDSVAIAAKNNLAITTARREEDGTVQVMSGRMGNRGTHLQEPGGSGVATYTGHWERAQGSDISAGGKLTLSAGQDITVQGSSAKAQGQTLLSAGRDINITTDTTHNRGTLQADSAATRVSASGQADTLYTSQIGGAAGLTVEAGKQLTLTGSGLSSSQGQTALSADTVTLQEARQQSADHDQEWGKRSQGQTLINKDKGFGSSISSSQGVNIVARQSDLTLQGSSIDADQGAIKLKAAQDVKLLASQDQEQLQQEHHSSSKGLFRSKRTDSIQEHQRTQAQGSSLSADSIRIDAGRDLTLQGGNVAATHDVELTAGRDVTLTTAISTERQFADEKTSTSGLMGSGGIGFSIGKQSQRDQQADTGTAEKGSTVGSILGNVNIHAGQQATLRGTDVIAGGDIDLKAKEIRIEAAENRYQHDEKHEASKSGLTVALSGVVGAAVNTAVQQTQEAKETDNGRLQALKGIQAGLSGYQAYQAYQEEAAKAPAEQSFAGISLSIGNQKSASHSSTSQSQSQGSSLQAGGNLSLSATGSGQRDAQGQAQDGDIRIRGSSLQAGKDLTLDAARDIELTASRNQSTETGGNTSSGWNLGISLGVSNSGAGLSIFANANKGKGSESGHGNNWQETTLNAGNTLQLQSGRDTTLTGAQASGHTIVAEVGRDLTLSSQQDEDHYHAKQNQASVGGSFTVGSMTGSGSFSVSKQKLDSDYRSVQEQTGLYAGSGGYDITVGQHTQLNGAVIGSTASADKNQLDTGTLGFSNLHNQADYKVESQSIGMSSGLSVSDQLKGTLMSQGASSLLGGGNSSGHAESTTYAAISDGSITIRDQDKQQQDIATLSRDVEHAANGLSPIFDKDKERQRLAEAQAIGAIGSQLIQVVATDKLAEANRKAGQDPDYANSQEYKDLQAQWGTGGTFQKAATAATAALQGLAGNNLQAALAGAAAPYLAGVVKDLTGDNKQANILAHAVVGAALAQLKGDNALAGAAGAGSAPLMADYLQQTLYPDAKNLTEEQKQTISALTTLASGLAGGLAGGNSAGGLTGMQAGKNEVENNTLSPKEINTLGKELQSQCGTLSGGSKSACENGLITAAVKESNRRNDFSPEYQAAFDATFNKAMADVSTICKANSQCVTEVANSLLMARLSCSTVECANGQAGGAVRNAALRYGSVLDVAKLAVGDFGWLVGLKGPSTTAANSAVISVRQADLNTLAANGVKFTPENVLATGIGPNGKIVFLENGSSSAGLQHIIERHAADFESKGIAQSDIPSVVMEAVTKGTLVGTNGSAPVYQIIYDGSPKYISVGVGSNGFIVRANPVSTWKPVQ